MSEEECFEAIENFRHSDAILQDLTIRDLEQMVGCCQRVHSMAKSGKGKGRPDVTIMDDGGYVSNFYEFRNQTNNLNIARLMLILKMYPAIETLFAASLLNRHFRNINREIGGELIKMEENLRRGLVVSQAEAERWSRKRERSYSEFGDLRMKAVCCGYSLSDMCQQGENCGFLHMVHERDLRNEPIFQGTFD